MLHAETGTTRGAIPMTNINAMTPRQARAARAALSLSVRRLSELSSVSDSSIRRIEEGGASLDLRVRLQKYFEQEGVTFYFSGDTRGLGWREI